jgi:hypothetical protein
MIALDAAYFVVARDEKHVLSLLLSTAARDHGILGTGHAQTRAVH